MDNSVFSIAAQNASFLALRQSVIARNIAMSNVPGYQAQDVRPFAETLDRMSIVQASTDPAHVADGRAVQEAGGLVDDTAWETYHSGTSVTLEHELAKSGHVMAAHRLNTGIVRSFHTMFLASVSG